ncbi:Hypothetical predicted protein [Marmota monax]|uniref:Uncharacterized protein n=1 Tax=Marmota monax TaxID=9995 RepID=A0A5E4DA41_MARMO|nr:hypothetical protein GHT09_018330 [Marmota monax]VTJ89619.1 Hypothetical predicted protein [Marmota monax]
MDRVWLRVRDMVRARVRVRFRTSIRIRVSVRVMVKSNVRARIRAIVVKGAAPSVNPDSPPWGLVPCAREEGVAGALRAKFEAGEATSGAPGFSAGGADGGAQRPRPPCAKPHKEAVGPPEFESPRPPQLPGAEGPAVSDGEEGGGEPGAGRGAVGAAGARR